MTRRIGAAMLLVENEYGSYGNDRNYIARLREVWLKNGITVPFYSADGPTPYMLEAGHVEGGAIGLDSGSEEKHWELARSLVPGVPIFSSETYPGWLTHWGEAWARPKIDELLTEVTFLLAHNKSFNFYVAHGTFESYGQNQGVVLYRTTLVGRKSGPADTFVDMSGYRKGAVWVNGHNLGRYWDIGPQKRLYCPAPWLKAGANQVIVFDLHKTEAAPPRGFPSHE